VNAIDTNILVRLLTEDDPVQSALAMRALADPTFISHGVLMETEWVLRSRYRWSRGEINLALERLTELANVTVTDRADLRWSLERHREGADLADMLHIVASRAANGFLTFDSRLPDRAGPAAPVPVVVLQ
jgi:predicted nucleic-acid-binding protein